MDTILAGKKPFHCVNIRCEGQKFSTTLYTLRQYSESKLALLFNDNFPLYDEITDTHLLPLNYGVSGDAFGAVLDYLQCGEWQPILEEKLYKDILTCLENLKLYIPLPCPPPPFSNSNNVIMPKYNYAEVILPNLNSDSNISTISCVEACAGLASRGYTIKKELHLPLLHEGNNNETSSRNSTILLLERKVPNAERLRTLSFHSPWLNALSSVM